MNSGAQSRPACVGSVDNPHSIACEPNLVRTADMHMTATPIFATDALPRGDRAPLWRECIWKHFGGLESDFYGDAEFDGRISSTRAGAVVMTRLSADRHRVIRTDALARGSDADCVKIVAPLCGSAGVHQHGRAAWVGAGGWTIYDMSGRYRVDNPERVEHLIVMLPKSAVLERGMRLHELMARPMRTTAGLSRVALEAMRGAWRELPLMGETAARGAGENIAQLVRLALLELGGADTAAGRRAAFKDRVRVYVERNLRDPSLSVGAIAAGLNCSKRHLHNAFADGTDTLAAYILKRRIAACIRDMNDDAAGMRSLTEIALGCGFTNLSHFSRVFHANTGTSPSVFRRVGSGLAFSP
jgi:AraC-like DNA-binding protein